MEWNPFYNPEWSPAGCPCKTHSIFRNVTVISFPSALPSPQVSP